MYEGDASEPVWSLRWDAFAEVLAWRRDVRSNDLVALGFRATDDDAVHVADEDMHGWEDLRRAVAERFGVQTDRLTLDQAFADVEGTYTVIWSARSASG